MCGIYGYIGRVKPKHRKKMVELMMELGAQTEVRGMDATGFYAKNDEFEYMEKHCVPASTFYLESDMFQEAILDGAFVFIGHNRQASIGDVCNDNAHPFLGEHIALVHNGTCGHAKNLLTAEERASMEGGTDSEAIMKYLERTGLESKQYMNLSNFSIVAFNRDTNILYFARDEYKPLVVLDLRKQYGVRVFASTVAIAKEAMEKCKIKATGVPLFSTRADYLYKVTPENGEVEKVFCFTLQTAAVKEAKKRQNVTVRSAHTSPVPKGEEEYKTPSYLSYLTNKNGYHFSKSPKLATVKGLVDKAMAVFGD